MAGLTPKAPGAIAAPGAKTPQTAGAIEAPTVRTPSGVGVLDAPVAFSAEVAGAISAPTEFNALEPSRAVRRGFEFDYIAQDFLLFSATGIYEQASAGVISAPVAYTPQPPNPITPLGA